MVVTVLDLDKSRVGPRTILDPIPEVATVRATKRSSYVVLNELQRFFLGKKSISRKKFLSPQLDISGCRRGQVVKRRVEIT